MSKIWALVKNNLVENTIVAEDSFIPLIDENYDDVIDVTNMIPCPAPGWSHINNTFYDAPSILVNESADITSAWMQDGSASTFIPFNLSNDESWILVQIVVPGFVDLGCIRYAIPFLRDALYRASVNNEDMLPIKSLGSGSCGHITDDGTVFKVSAVGISSILNALQTLNVK